MRPCSTPTALALAWQTLRGRGPRTWLTVFQFAVGFAALLLMMALAVRLLSITRALAATFPPPDVLGLYPYSTGGGRVDFGPDLVFSDLSELGGLPGVRGVAVFWSGVATLSNGETVPLFVLNSEFERMARLRVHRPGVGPTTGTVRESANPCVYLTSAAWKRRPAGLAGVAQGDVLEFSVPGGRVRATLGGTVDAPAGWPPAPAPSGISEFAYDVPALVIDLGLVADLVPLSNAVWLGIADGATPSEVSRAVSEWYAKAHPDSGLDIRGISVAEEIQRQAASRNPAVWVAGVLGGVLLTLAGLGFAGQCMLMAESRRMEWALRLALGATRAGLVKQVVLETVLVIGLGAIGGATAAVTGVWIAGLAPGGRSLAWILPSAVAALAVLSVLSVVAAGFPAWRASRQQPADVLRESL